MALKVRSQTLIAVRDVRASAEWYGRLLGLESLAEHEHRNFYDRLMDGRSIVMQLHAWDVEHHPNLESKKKKSKATPGHGVLLWFELDDFDAAVTRAKKMRATIVEEPHVNPGPQHREIWLRDPDGYVVVVASPDGEALKATRRRKGSRRPTSR
ncbi:MAG TPA: VOC family protein [Labilithrix sp.]